MPFNVSSVLRDATESTGNYTFERGSCGEQLALSRYVFLSVVLAQS